MSNKTTLSPESVLDLPEVKKLIAKSAFEQMDNMFMFSEDEKAFAQREQLGHEDKARSFDLPGNLSYIPENDPVDTVAPALRPYGAILNELTEERSATATRHWKTKSGAMSKRTKEVQAVDETKVDELFDEVAAHVLLANPSESQDDKLEVLIDLQEKGNLSEADMTNIMDKMGAFERGTKTPETIPPEAATELVGYPTDEEIKKSRDKFEAEELAYTYTEKERGLGLFGERLQKDRRELANLSILLRGRHSQKMNEELYERFNAALTKYGETYESASQQSVDLLRLQGQDETIIGQSAVLGVASEHRDFTAAELTAFDEKNPKMGKVAKWWSKKGLAKKSLYGFGASAGVTALAGGIVAATGVGAVIAGGALLSVKAARTVGMYRFNKRAGAITSFESSARSDYLQAIKEVANGESNDYAKIASDSMFSVVDRRVETDQKTNRKRLAIVVGASVLSATLGHFAGNFFADRSPSGSVSGSGSGQLEGSPSGTGSASIESGDTSPDSPTGTGYSGNTVDTSEAIETTEPTGTSGVDTGSIPADTDVGQTADSVDLNEDVAPTEDVTSETESTTQDGTGAETAETIATDTESVSSADATVEKIPQTSTLDVPSGDGFEDSIQQQFGLSDAQSHEAFLAMKPHLAGQANTYIENGDIRIASPGSMQLNPQAAAALRGYLESLESDD